MAGFYQLLATTLAMILCIIPLNIGHALVGSHGETKILCVESESEALLKFKQGLEDTSNRFSSWAPGTDCCKWKGVKCNGTTGHVVSLDLGLPYDLCFSGVLGEINSGLLGLPDLTYLDLSCNNFYQSQLLAFLGSLNNLQHLNLSLCSLEGTIPNDLRNLSRLQSLDLSYNVDLRANNLEWLYSLSSLKVLNLSGIDLSNTADGWMHAVNVLPSLAELHLEGCLLDYVPPSLPQVNCDSLLTLDLSYNDFNTSAVLDWVSQCCHNLCHLDLSRNFDLRVSNLEWLNNLSSLKVLDLSRVNLNRTTDSWIHAIQVLPSLEELHLANCQLDYMPPFLPEVNCDSLLTLDLSSNQFNTSVILDWVSQCYHNLHHLDLSYNYDLRVSNLEWLNSLSSLKVLNLSGVNLNRTTDSWIHAIQVLPSLEELHLANCQLDYMPPSLPEVNCDSLLTLDLSSNQFNTSVILDWVSQCCHNLHHLDLSYNYDLRVSNLEWLNSLSSLKVLDLSGVNLNRTTDSWIHAIQVLPSLEELHLANCQLDYMPPSLPEVNCDSLLTLDLSSNQFNTSVILDWVSQCCHNLHHLDLSYNYDLRVSNLEWLNSLSSLKVLDLSGVNLNRTTDSWINAIQVLPSLEELYLIGCQHDYVPPSLPQGNCDSHVTLDLSYNNFNTSAILDWVFQSCHNLRHLDLSSNELKGEIPALTHLANGSLSGPNLGVSQFGRRSSLRELRLRYNKLNGTLKTSFMQQLSQLIVLDVSHNDLEGVITDVHLENFQILQVLVLSRNHLIFNITREWIPPFQLETIGLSHCQLGPQFPKWIQTQKNLLRIDISNNNISDIVPDWFWNVSLGVNYMDLSYNDLKGHVPDFSSEMNLQILDLSNNNFTGPLPKFPKDIQELNLARNSFFGPIFDICSINSSSLMFLHLFSNKLSGNLPNCWTNVPDLSVLHLADNQFFGSIPDSIGALTDLNVLSLNNNNFSGNLPLFMKNCSSLILLDLGRNKLSGTIPSWINDENMPHLAALILSANAFHGNIPKTLCSLKGLQILVLSLNHLSGAIPPCSFVPMATEEPSHYLIVFSYSTDGLTMSIEFTEGLLLSWKKNYLSFSGVNFGLIKTLDLSSNFLTGDIPKEITHYVGLKSLNLSRNQLEGAIPFSIGNMESLEALDLSRNKLSGIIPTSMTNIDQLSTLDVSHNNLTGPIPLGRHFDTFDASSFMDNPNLCGRPLNKSCSTTNGSFQDAYDSEKGGGTGGLRLSSFYISMGIGFVTGFWAICGPLLLSRSWNQAYFGFLGRMYDKIYVMVAITMTKLRTKLEG